MPDKRVEKKYYTISSFQLLQRQIWQRIHRYVFISYVYDSPQSIAKGFALEKGLGLRNSHGTIRNVLEKHKYSLRVARKKPLLSAQNVEKILRCTTEQVSVSAEY